VLVEQRDVLVRTIAARALRPPTPDRGRTEVQIFQELEEANRAYVEGGAHVARPVRPARQLAIVTCMDSRIPVFPSSGSRSATSTCCGPPAAG
jgi:hypothetical protein